MRDPALAPADAPPRAGQDLPAIEARPSRGEVWPPVLEEEEDHLPKRSLGSKLFGIGVWGWVKLAALSVFVGVVFQLAGVNPLAADFTIADALGDLAQSLADLAGWSLANGWHPAITGALIVVPLWIVWRLVSVPFRR
ncbi:MAG: hypothetical protein SGJ21_04600 [Alphaproteobacteria bacterium]|nr:hypothetical protein [Alphaproteobacteria bacterium]